MATLTAHEQTMVLQILAFAKTKHFTPSELISLQLDLVDAMVAAREVK